MSLQRHIKDRLQPDRKPQISMQQVIAAGDHSMCGVYTEKPNRGRQHSRNNLLCTASDALLKQACITTD